MLRSAASVTRRSEMSRRIAVNKVSPSRVSLEMEASAGNSVPSLRRPATSPCSPMRRAWTGPAANSPKCRRWASTAEEIFGYTAREVLGEPLRAVKDGERRGASFAARSQKLASISLGDLGLKLVACRFARREELGDWTDGIRCTDKRKTVPEGFGKDRAKRLDQFDDVLHAAFAKRVFPARERDATTATARRALQYCERRPAAG